MLATVRARSADGARSSSADSMRLRVLAMRLAFSVGSICDCSSRASSVRAALAASAKQFVAFENFSAAGAHAAIDVHEPRGRVL